LICSGISWKLHPVPESRGVSVIAGITEVAMPLTAKEPAQMNGTTISNNQGR